MEDPSVFLDLPTHCLPGTGGNASPRSPYAKEFGYRFPDMSKPRDSIVGCLEAQGARVLPTLEPIPCQGAIIGKELDFTGGIVSSYSSKPPRGMC
jgi:hypothetical protein